MKLCVNCKYHKRVGVQQGNRGFVVDMCQHPDFVDPVNGEQIPCAVARKEKDFCAIAGKGFVQAEVESSNKDVEFETVPEPSRIIV